MRMRLVALGSALAGGMCLVANLFVDVEALSWVGLGLVGLAVLVAGARLVRAPWLAVVSGVGSLALAWALLETLRDEVPSSAREVEAIAGGVATLGVALAVLRRTPATPGTGGAARAGNHRS
ncbi:hypothetical protein ABFT23_12325 [Nocardioides sp. C4-1]|uniref:hypothetical protein n=1 Tax=Nocardioides sp. C4-1 TaxID=3151851 RepID=UPI00326480EE